MDVDLNGTTIHLDRPSDKAVVQRVAAQIQRRIAEDDWRPYSSKADALGAWKTRRDSLESPESFQLGQVSDRSKYGIHRFLVGLMFCSVVVVNEQVDNEK